MTKNDRLLLDTSAWIEILEDSPAASKLLRLVESASEVVVPTIVLYELERALIRSGDEDTSLIVEALLRKYRVIPLDERLASLAAQASVEHRLGTADSVILASAMTSQSDLVTFDNDFRGLPRCRVLPKG